MVGYLGIYGNVRAGNDCGDGHSGMLDLFFLPRYLEQVRSVTSVGKRGSQDTSLETGKEKSGVCFGAISAGRNGEGLPHVGCYTHKHTPTPHPIPTVMALRS